MSEVTHKQKCLGNNINTSTFLFPNIQRKKKLINPYSIPLKFSQNCEISVKKNSSFPDRQSEVGQ